MALNFLNDGYFAGKVGIGTESPDRKLHVKDSAIVVSEFEGTNTGSLLDLVNSNASQLYNGIRFTQGTSSKMAVTHIADGTTKGYVQIGNSWATGSEILVVDGRTSNVGIGTVSPTYPLHVSSTFGYPILVERTNSNDAGIRFKDQSTTNANSVRIGAIGNAFRIFTDGSEQFRITSAGNIGIGTSSPGAKLDVIGQGIFQGSTTSSYKGANVGTLNINNNSADGTVDFTQGLVFTDNVTNQGSWTHAGIVSVGSTGYNGSLVFGTDGDGVRNTSGITEKMRITAAGNIGVNTTSPSQKLHVTGNLRVTGAYYDSNNSPGTANQVLVSTATGTDWIDGSAIPGVPAGSGTLNTIPLWTPDGDTLGNSHITQSTALANDIIIPQYVRHTSDTNTYFGFGLNDTINFGTSGSERMRINSSGNVGIGNTNPQYPLHFGDISGYYISIGSGNSTPGGNTPWLGVFNNNSITSATYGWGIYDSSADGSFQIWNRAGNTTGYNTFTIKRGGNVGIGTTSPQAKFVVSNNGAAGMEFQPELGTDTNRILNYDRITSTYMNLRLDANAYQFRISGSEKVTITSTGNVGIGTTSPSKPLHVNGGGLNFVAEFQSTDDKASILIQDDDTLNYIHSQDGYLSLGGQATLSASNLNINSSSGNVGIGTPGPSEKLHVNAGTSNTVALFESTDARSRIVLKDNSGEVHLNAIGDNITFETSASGTERMRITSGGNVGIGTTSPAYNLDVNSSDYVAARIESTADGYAPASILLESGNSNSRGQGIYQYNSVSKNSWFSGVPYNTTSDDWIIAHKLETTSFNSDVAQMSNALFCVNDNGNVGIGTASPTAKLHVVGTGLFTGLVSGITPVAAANFVTKAYVDGSGGGTGPFLPLAGGTMTGTAGVVFPDNFNLKIGTGSDLKIFHNATDSFIINEVGNLKITNGANDKDIIFESDNGSGGVEPYMTLNGSNRSIVVSAALGVYHNDGIASRFGNAGDLQIYHNSTNSIISNATGNLYIKATAADKDIVFEADDGSGGTVAEYFRLDGGSELTFFSKAIQTADNAKIFVGNAGDLQIYHNATDSVIENITGDLYITNKADDRDIIFRSDNGSGGFIEYFRLDGSTEQNVVSKNMRFEDGIQAQFGAGTDLRIYHDGGNSLIKDTGTGVLYIGTNAFRLTSANLSENMISAFEDGAVNLYYNNSLKIATTTTGVAVTGAATATTATTSTDNNATLTTKGYVDGLVTGVPVYKGTWDARNSTERGSGSDGGDPDLRLNANKVLGNYYIVETAGSATPNGANTEPSSWNVGDWCIFSDVTSGAGTDLWQKIDNTSVISGAGTGQSVTKWEGTSGATSETLTDGPITFSGNNSTFAGNISVTGTTFLDGLVTIDHNLNIQNNGVLRMAGTEVISATRAISATTGTFTGTIQSDDITIVDGTNDVNLYLANTSYGIQLDYSAGDMLFRTNGGTRLTIANGGNATFAGDVNITNSKLQITAAAPEIIFSVPSGGLDSRIYNDGSGNFIIGNGTNSSTPTERMRISSNGSVGINSTSTSYKLFVGGTSRFANSVYIDTNTGADALWVTRLGGASEALKIYTTDSSSYLDVYQDENQSGYGNLLFRADDTGDKDGYLWFGHRSRGEAMRIIDNGNVGIGTTSPSFKLQTNATITGSWLGYLNGTSATFGTNNFSAVHSSTAIGTGTESGINLANNASDVGAPSPIISFSAKSASANYQHAYAAIYGIKTATGADTNWNKGDLVFATGQSTGPNERMRIDSAGAIKFNNYNSTNNTGTPTYLLGTDASGNVVKTNSAPSPITSQAASLYDLIPNGAFTTTYAFTSTAGTYAKVMQGDDVITANGTYTVQMFVNDNAVGGTQYSETYSGIMSWGSSTNTNDAGNGSISEIVLHRSGHAANQGMTYLRTRETTSSEGNELRLEIMCNRTYTGASNVVFKFVRLI